VLNLNTVEAVRIWVAFATSANTDGGGSASPEDAAMHADKLFEELQKRTTIPLGRPRTQ
jgi:hypothetical protein